MVVYLQGTPTWWPENSVNIWNLLFNFYKFFDKHVHSFMSRTAITLNFKMCLFSELESSRLMKIITLVAFRK